MVNTKKLSSLVGKEIKFTFESKFSGGKDYFRKGVIFRDENNVSFPYQLIYKDHKDIIVGEWLEGRTIIQKGNSFYGKIIVTSIYWRENDKFDESSEKYLARKKVLDEKLIHHNNL